MEKFQKLLEVLNILAVFVSKIVDIIMTLRKK